MNTISITYTLKWQHKEYNHYKWSKCGKLFNMQTGRIIRKVVNGRSVGYWVKGKFVTLKRLRNQLEKIPKNNLPF